MKKLFLLFATLPALLCGCSSFEEFNDVPALNPISELRAGFADESRTYVENGTYLRWHADDRLTAFYGNTLNRQYKFNGKTGDNSGTFSLVPSGELGTGNAFDRIYALYPYSETAAITDEGVISLTLPAEQSYAENSFGKDANTMIAVTENLEDTFLSFKNACGYLKLKLYNTYGVRVKSIEIRGNNNEKIAGSATATIEFGGVPTLAMTDDATSSITLDCGDGVALGTTAETATEFWVVVPKTTFISGITITVTDSFGAIFTKATDKEVSVKRNVIQPMAALDCCSETPIIGLSYTTNDGNPLTPTTTKNFGATFIENKFDEATSKGVLIFDQQVTKIPVSAFENCTNLSWIDIPMGITTIGNYAFRGCSGMENIFIPNSIISIGAKSFEDCAGKATIDCNLEYKGYYTGYQAYLNTFEDAKFTEIIIGNNVDIISERSFNDCKDLHKVYIPGNVKIISTAAFGECSKLTNVELCEGIIEIGGSAFVGCTSLTSITIPDGVATIGHYAFNTNQKCYLETIYCKGKVPPILEFHYNIHKINLYVPIGYEMAYQNAEQWEEMNIIGYKFTE